MNERNKTVEYITDEAKRIVTKDRHDQHGNAEDSFRMIAQFWMVYLEHVNRKRPEGGITIHPEDVAEMMSLLKKARKVCGYPSLDNYIDDVGYVALAGALVAPVPSAVAAEPYISAEEVRKRNFDQAQEYNRTSVFPTTKSVGYPGDAYSK